MKGMVFNLLESAVTDEYSAEVWDDAIEAAGVVGVYSSLGTYPFSEMGALVAALSKRTGIPVPDLFRWFGERALAKLAEQLPDLFARYAGTREFVLHLNDVIHPEVRKLLPGAAVPEFDYSTIEPDHVVMRYSSSRALCTFAEGLIVGTTRHYGDTVTIRRPTCTHRGDTECTFDLHFGDA
jgi:predicted hydrocarbon binding protein